MTVLDSLPTTGIEKSEGLAFSCPQGDVIAWDTQLPNDVQNLHTGLYILCLLSRL